jgi:hypothetical protein
VSTIPGTQYRIHISGIDEFLATRLAETERGAICFNISGADSTGSITLSEIDTPHGSAKGDGVDFELSTCECRGLDTWDIEDYLGKPVYTSSAYEFFDFVLGYLSSFDFLVEFSGNAWKILVINPAGLKRVLDAF